MDDADRENQGEGGGLMDKAKEVIGDLFSGGEADSAAPPDVRDLSGTSPTDSYGTETGVGLTGGGMGGYERQAGADTTDVGAPDVTEGVGRSAGTTGLGTPDVGVGEGFDQGTRDA